MGFYQKRKIAKKKNKPRCPTTRLRCRVVGASTFGTVNSGLIPSRVKPRTSKLVFTASLHDAQHQWDSVENKPASLLAVPLVKAPNGIPPSWCGRQVAGNSQASSL